MKQKFSSFLNKLFYNSPTKSKMAEDQSFLCGDTSMFFEDSATDEEVKKTITQFTEFGNEHVFNDGSQSQREHTQDLYEDILSSSDFSEYDSEPDESESDSGHRFKPGKKYEEREPQINVKSKVVITKEERYKNTERRISDTRCSNIGERNGRDRSTHVKRTERGKNDDFLKRKSNFSNEREERKRAQRSPHRAGKSHDRNSQRDRGHGRHVNRRKYSDFKKRGERHNGDYENCPRRKHYEEHRTAASRRNNVGNKYRRGGNTRERHDNSNNYTRAGDTSHRYNKIKVTGLDRSIKDADVLETFDRYGDITQFYFPRAVGRSNTKHVFLTFSNYYGAQRALNSLNGRRICGSKMVITPMFSRRMNNFWEHVDERSFR